MTTYDGTGADTGYTLVLSGSNRVASHSRALGDHVARQLEQAGERAVVVDLAEQRLPFHDPADHHALEQSPDARVRAFTRLAADAHALVWVTPVYHGTLSGVLKNALDNLSIKQLAGKPVLLMANGGGRFGGAVFDHMRTMAVNLHAVAVTCQVLALGEDFAPIPDGGYQPVDAQLLSRIERGTGELLSLTGALVRERVRV
ncbi:NADPH-dependent FMN reductase [Streptomyces sp. NPDC059906]|uniref:NADPH-dependent FMN reductase n=1 Tax=Streptomyces sp. NPDC059906 TaxID=3346997 RepID=UPI00365DBF36